MASVIYTSKHSDYWDAIAKKYYGSEHYMYLLLEANPELAKHEVLPANLQVVVPEKPQEIKPAKLPIWKR